MTGERLVMQESLFYAFRLEGHVPSYHLLRSIDCFVGCSELRQRLAGSIVEALRTEAGETVLVVEDETVIRELIVEMLQDLGYRAPEAADGPAGFRIVQSHTCIDLLVTDVGPPGINGHQFADQARASCPDMKVLFMTGYAENATLVNSFLKPGMEMITKPFAVDALATRIRSMIQAFDGRTLNPVRIESEQVTLIGPLDALGRYTRSRLPPRDQHEPRAAGGPSESLRGAGESRPDLPSH